MACQHLNLKIIYGLPKQEMIKAQMAQDLPYFNASHFLKANNQDKGIESYSYVVALLVDYLEE